MIVSELISKLNKMVSTGVIHPDCEVVVSPRDGRSGAPLEEMYVRKLSWHYDEWASLLNGSTDEESVENRILCIEAISDTD